MTSLAHQLKRLALPQSDPNLLTRKEVASLLFDPKDAATMDRSTFYALGKSCLWSSSLHWWLILPACMTSLLHPPQAARGWRSCWELNQPSWSSKKHCSAEHHWRWSVVYSPKRPMRSWTPTSRFFLPVSARTFSSNQLTSASSGWFTGMASRTENICFFKVRILLGTHQKILYFPSTF